MAIGAGTGGTTPVVDGGNGGTGVVARPPISFEDAEPMRGSRGISTTPPGFVTVQSTAATVPLAAAPSGTSAAAPFLLMAFRATAAAHGSWHLHSQALA